MKHVKNRIVIKVDVNQKNNYTFSNGTTIQMERDVQNLDNKYTKQVLGEVVSSDYIPEGSLVLFHHNSVHEVNVVSDSKLLTTEDMAKGLQIISLSESECFLWKPKGEGHQWTTLKGFCTALRVFKPYEGVLEGIEHKLIRNVLYLTSGEYKGLVVHCLKASDYLITFRNENGKDENLIRVRHFEDDDLNEREEIICIDNALTKGVKQGELLVGLSPIDCKQL